MKTHTLRHRASVGGRMVMQSRRRCGVSVWLYSSSRWVCRCPHASNMSSTAPWGEVVMKSRRKRMFIWSALSPSLTSLGRLVLTSTRAGTMMSWCARGLHGTPSRRSHNTRGLEDLQCRPHRSCHLLSDTGSGGGGGGVYSESYTLGGAIPNEVGPARCRAMPALNQGERRRRRRGLLTRL